MPKDLIINKKESLINIENNDLKKIVNNIEVSKKKIKKKVKTKKPKKLPSVNLMKTKTIRFIKEKRSILLLEILKNKKNYLSVIKNIWKMRDETRLFKNLINKKPSDVKDLYFKYFWHIHWINQKNINK